MLLTRFFRQSRGVFAGALSFQIALWSVLAPLSLAQVTPEEIQHHLKAFELTRRMMSRQPVRVFLREALKEFLVVDPDLAMEVGFESGQIKEVAETQFLLLLKKNSVHWNEIEAYLADVPELDPTDPEQLEIRRQWQERFREILQDPNILAEFRRINNPLEPYVLAPKDGTSAYENVRLYVNHWLRDGRKWIPPDDLRQKAVDFILSTKQKLMVNSYDFDLMALADAMVQIAQEGKEVVVGIDKNDVLKRRPEVRAVFERLEQGGVFVHAVDSVGLNHQKIMVRDWDLPGEGEVLFSSGNFTQSDIGPEGDLVNVSPRPKQSIPNANHMVIVESNLLALTVHHELSKTLHPDFQLRGRQYPLGGAYQFPGPPASNGEPTYLVVAFTPGGGLKDVNQNIISRAIRLTEGPIYMAQFAFSSDKTGAALLERAKREVERTGRFDFLGVGETPFAMQYWSEFLEMAGLQRVEAFEIGPDGQEIKFPYFQEIENSPWKELLGEDGLNELRSKIRIAPPRFGTFYVEVNGTRHQITAKLHHKLIVTGPVSFLGTSFNFSKNAQTNQEHVVLFKDPALARQASLIVQTLTEQSRRSVYEEALRRNRRVYRYKNPSCELLLIN